MSANDFIWVTRCGLKDEDVYRGAGFQPITCLPGDLQATLPSSLGKDGPIAVFIGEENGNTVKLARQAHKLLHDCPIIFLAEGKAAEALKLDLSWISMVGTYWIAPPGDLESHLRLLEDCRRLFSRRSRLRTSLDRMNTRLSTRPDEDRNHYRKLLLSDHYLTSILSQASDAILSLNKVSTVVTWNKGAEALFGIPEKEAVGMLFRDLLPESERGELERILAQGISQEGGKEVYFLKSDGSSFPGEMTVGDMSDEHGAEIGKSVIIRDISGRKRLEAELVHAQKMEAIGKLAGGVAHDFNNLLTAINGYSELALEEVAIDTPLREMLQEIRASGERAARLTSQLLAFSRKQMLMPKVIDLNALVAELGNMFKRLIGEHIEIVTMLDPRLGKVKADPAQVEQIIVNLVLNARDAMPNGGQLTIETVNKVLDKNYVSTHFDSSPGPHVMLAVSDTGMGMSPEVKARIFEPFFTTKGVGKGTGLGLSSVYGAVKQSGGSIWAYSELGSGTTFKIYFPMLSTVDGAAPDAADKEDSHSQAGGPVRKTVLLVEDEDTVRNFARRVLENAGYEVFDCRNGSQAMQTVDSLRAPIDILITDVVMPGMNGRKLAEYLEGRISRLKVLYISGYTDNAIVHYGVLDDGANFLQKPFTPKQILHAVASVLNDTPFPSKS